MKKLIAVFLLAVMPAFSFAAETGLELDKVDIDLGDKAAMQDGARTLPTIAWVATVPSSSVTSGLPMTLASPTS